MINLGSTYPIAIDIHSQNIYAVQLKETRDGLAVQALAHRQGEGWAEKALEASDDIVSQLKEMAKAKVFRGNYAILRLEHADLTIGLEQGQRDGQIVLVLVELGTACFALFLQFVQGRDNRRQELKNDRRSDVRTDAQHHDAKVRHGPTREHVQQVEQLVLLCDLLQHFPVYVGQRDVRRKTIDHQDQQSDQELSSEIRQFKGVQHTL